MARPRKGQDYVVHRVADLVRYGKGLPSSQFKQGDSITLADKTVRISDLEDVPWAIGKLLCNLKFEYLPQVLRQVANALERKPVRKGRPDDIAKIRIACQKAKAELKGLYRGDDPTFKEVAEQYHKLTGLQLDRRALKDAGCSVRPESKSKKLPRRM